MSSDDIAIRVCNLSKSYQIYETPRDRLKQFVLPRLQRVAGQATKQYYREFRALNDVSFEVRKGETVGIIGRNGSGKSTLLQIICGTLSPTGGTVETRGRIAALLELGSGFNPDFTGRENVYMNASVLGLSNEEIDWRFDQIVAFADIGDFMDQPLKTYSSGMQVRLAFAVAVHVEPNLLVIDEALSVGDIRFQNKCLRKLSEFRDSGCSTFFVSHSPGMVEALCDRAVWIEQGQVREIGRPAEVVHRYVDFMVHGVVDRGDESATQEQGMLGDIDGWPWKEINLANNVKALPGYEIKRVRLRHDAKINQTQIDSEPIELCVQFEILVPENVHQPLIGFGIFNELNEPVVHFNSYNNSAELDALQAGHPVTVQITASIPALRPGEYLVALGLDDGIPGAHRLLCHVYDSWVLRVSMPTGGRFQSGYVQISGTSISFLEKSE